jgi:hypothetical protein
MSLHIVYAKYLDIILQTRVILGQVFLETYAFSCVMLGEKGYVDISLFVVDPGDRVMTRFSTVQQTKPMYEVYKYC